MEERDASGGNVTKRFFPQGEQINSSKYYYTFDHLGSIRELTDTNGVVVALYDYDPYGRRKKVSGTLDADFGFTGHYYHAASGLYLALYRAYDANLGRWLNRDPLEEDGGLNLYAYVDGNPINSIDPSGLFSNSFKEGFITGAKSTVVIGALIFAFPETATFFAIAGGLGLLNAGWEAYKANQCGSYSTRDEILGEMTGGISVGVGTGLAGRAASTRWGVGRWLTNQGTKAILRNGYYEVNGFKISEYYYNRLWTSGRSAPTLIAREILRGSKKITPDLFKNGFYNYEFNGWEMTYNPFTKEIWHLQPVK